MQHLAAFVRTHEKALANALQFRKQNVSRHKTSQSVSSIVVPSSPNIDRRPSTSASNASSGLAAALSLGSLSLTSNSVKPATLALTPHHLFYLLSKIDQLDIPVGPMKVRLENLHDTSSAANYVSFLSQSHRSNSRSSDAVSIRSVSSIRSVMSGMTSLWSSFGFGGNSEAKLERQRQALESDLKYLYSAFTKIPALKLAPDWRARLIRGYEEFPFDSAVPLYVFKNVQSLEVKDIDYRQFFGWDRMADNLRTLVLKRANVNQPSDILIDIVLDDMDGRRRRTAKKDHQSHSSPTTPWPASSTPRSNSPTTIQPESIPRSLETRSSTGDIMVSSVNGGETSVPTSRRPSINPLPADSKSPKSSRPHSHSPTRHGNSRHASAHSRNGHKVKRSGSGSSHSSISESWHVRGSTSNLLALGIIPASKWRFLKHLGLPENGMVELPVNGLSPLANTLVSMDLSGNQFNSIPDSLATLTGLRSLNLAHNVINDLRTLKHSPLPAITALNLRSNRLSELAGIETLYPLERLDLRENQIRDPVELKRLTGIPELREIYVEGNPFTRTYRDYRVTLFNFFRQTAGFTEDIIIDGTGPSYSEKKRLVERVPVPPAVPVVKQPTAPLPAIDVSKPAIVYDTPREPAVLRKERPIPKATTSEIHNSSSRRKRAPKRRIVDLSSTDTKGGSNAAQLQPAPSIAGYAGQKHTFHKEQTSKLKTYTTEAPLPKYNISCDETLPSQATQVQTAADINSMCFGTSSTPQLPSLFTYKSTEPDWPDPQQWEIDAEVYRRKIEALRDEVGSGYLSVLSEEPWEQPRHTFKGPEFSSSHIMPTASTRIPSAQAIHSGRTLG